MKTLLVVVLVLAVVAAAGWYLSQRTAGKFPEPKRVEITVPNPLPGD